MEDFRLKNLVNQLQLEVDNLYKEIHTMKQQQQDMLDQIKRLKGEQDDEK
jgi:Mg2+ and Co2+ transporter CorA